ncbi:MAG: hypothetical protein QG666_1283 [Euryarchaeota archaeon]|nr:hypothetical protein [Euryarchaeota archaeon]
MELKTTFTATESRTFAVPFVGMPAVRALLRSVSGIYKENMLSKSIGLVADKLLKLAERPAIELTVELFASSLLNADLAQIFKSKYSIFRVHNLLRYAMVYISHKPSFLTSHLLKFAFGRFGAFGLQLFSKIGISSTPIFDLLRVVKRVIRADCNIHYTAIYSKNTNVCNLLWILVFQRHMQIEHLASPIIRNCRGFDGPSKVISVMRRSKESCLDSACCARNCRDSVYKVHSYDSLIISHRRERLTFWTCFTFDSFQSFASTVSCPLHQGRRKIGDALTSKLVGCIVVIHSVPRLVLESPFCGEGECIGVSSHRIEESLAILVSQPKFECYRPKHIIYVGD